MILSHEIAKPLLVGLLGCVSTIASHRRVAIYHDGLRTVVAEVEAGTKTRRELAKYAYSLSFPFVIGAALPYALATGIIVIHMVCLGGDVIGSRVRTWRLAGLLGFVYAGLMTLVVDLFVLGMRQLPLGQANLHLLWLPLAYTFPLLGAIAAGQLWGAKWGAIGIAATLAVWWPLHVAVRAAGYDKHGPFDSGSITLMLATIVLFVVAYRSVKTEGTDLSFFEPNIKRIHGNWPFLVVIAALISLLASYHWLAGEPGQAALLGSGLAPAAAAVAFFSAIGFIQLQGMTGLVSGVWNQDGYPDWFLGLGYVIGNPFAAAAAGAAAMGVELLSLRAVGRLLTTRPVVSDLGNAIRDSMDLLPNIAILAGGVMAAIATAGVPGACAIVAAVYINDVRGRPVTPLAVPVFAYLFVALVQGVGAHLGAWH
ncbi:MAG: transporter [Dactylosporangium sp.]|nr:transporter [Dactylosporangium sp.]